VTFTPFEVAEKTPVRLEELRLIVVVPDVTGLP
jgi:hypothetical protein